MWQSFLEVLKKYVVSDYLKKLVISYAVKAAGIGGGLYGFIAKIVIKKFYDFINKYVKRKLVEGIVTAGNEKDKIKYEEIVNNPNATADDIKNAAPDFLGGTINKP